MIRPSVLFEEVDMEVRWMIRYGVDDSHLTECLPGTHRLRREAFCAFDDFSPIYPYKIVQVLRLQFENEYEGASDVRVVAEKRLNTKTMMWG